MLSQIEGSQAIARAVALARPQVICAYPISPQTHIVEALSILVKSGQLDKCEFINVESEFAALSVAIGASAAGARTYTATASQGLLFMIEAVYNAAGLGLPIVMTIANRAIGAPINIWNDHSDAMAVRDSGWIQVFAENNQDALDLHIFAFRLAEELSIPVMVNMDGFILTHATERVDLPDCEVVDAFLPPYNPQTYLSPADPISIGAMVGPEAFTEVKYLEHLRQKQALETINRLAQEFEAVFGRRLDGIVSGYCLEDAEIAVLAMGSVVGTIKDAVDEMRDGGIRIGVLSLKTFRPFPTDILKKALSQALQIVVVEKAVSVGQGGVISSDLSAAFHDNPVPIRTVIAGLGGRPISKKALLATFTSAAEGTLSDETFLDLNQELIADELDELTAASRNTGTAHPAPVDKVS